MAPVKKKNSRYRNKQLDYNSLSISEVLCPICRTIIIEPVSLPCHHLFCLKCFNSTIENNSLSCPICRLRIGSWLRSASKTNSVVNSNLWEYIRNNFKTEVEAKFRGAELTTSNTNEPVNLKLAEPGEIGEEYKKQLSAQQEIYRLEREKEEKLSQELLKKLQEQEEQNRLQEQQIIKNDEEIAKKLAESMSNTKLQVNNNSSTCFNSSQKSKNNIPNIISNYGFSNSKQNVIKSNPNQCNRTDKPCSYEYNIKKITTNNQLKNSGPQNSYTNACEQNKHSNSMTKYDCLIKSFSMKLAQGKEVVKQGSPKTQQLHAMSLLRELGETYDDNDELAKKYDSITQELCHFKPIKTALVTKRRLVNGKPVINPLAISPPKRPIPKTSINTVEEFTTFTLRGTKVLKYSGSNSAFAAHPTIYLCENLIISGYENEISNKPLLNKGRKRLFEETDQNKNINFEHKLDLNNPDKLNDLTVNFVNTPKKTYSNVRVKFNSMSPKKSKSSAKELFGIKSIDHLKNTKFSDGFKPLNFHSTVNDVENSDDEAFSKKLLQEQKDLEFAKKLQDYLNKCDTDNRPYTLRKNNTKNNYLVSDYKRGTRTSPRKRQTTLDSIFLSTHK